jgi:Super-infection exclusion protein B
MGAAGWIGDLLKLGEWLRSPRFWFGVFLFCAALLLAPQSWLHRLGVFDLATRYHPWLVVIALFALALLTAELLATSSGTAFERFRFWRRHRVSMDYLKNLTATEKAVLQCYIKNDTETWYFDFGDGVVSGLITKELLYPSGSVGDMITGFPYNIQPWARHHLLKHPGLLEGAVKPTTRMQRTLGPW